MELVVKFHGRPSIASLGESTGWVCRDVGSGSHLMRATLWQVLNVSNVHTHCGALPLAARLELKCVDRQRWQQQTRALELLYKAVQRRSTSSGE